MTRCPGKRAFQRQTDARRACATAGWRVRVYMCGECRAWHIANHGKGYRGKPREVRRAEIKAKRRERRRARARTRMEASWIR